MNRTSGKAILEALIAELNGAMGYSEWLGLPTNDHELQNFARKRVCEVVWHLEPEQRQTLRRAARRHPYSEHPLANLVVKAVDHPERPLDEKEWAQARRALTESDEERSENVIRFPR